MCGTDNPHWALDQKMQMKLEGNLYLFQCEQCKGVLASTVADVTGFNSTPLTTMGMMKKLSGKSNKEIYMRIYDVGNNAELKDLVGKEFTLTEINKIAVEKNGNSDNEVKFY